MIAKLKGTLDSTGDDWAIIDVNGVGYMVYCSSKTLDKLGPNGGVVGLLIETQIREDAFNLFGFADAEEKRWFALLTSVQGVGAKVGLAILSAIQTDQLALALASGDKKVVATANGVGPKLAARIVTELKDKATGMTFASPLVAATADGSGSAGPTPNSDLREAISALTNLGYGQQEAFVAVNNAAQEIGDDASLQSLITAGLKNLTKA